jgi:predicted nuclease of restriction endonuclease-like (RecB) superfamily
MKRKPAKAKTLAAATRDYASLLADLKHRIRVAQVRAAMMGNASTLLLYWEIGGVLVERQKDEGWGAGVLPRLEADLKNELPEEKGFSERNMRRMIQFYREYPGLLSIRTQAVSELDHQSPGAIRTQPVAKFGQPPVAQLPELECHELLQVTWAHNLILMQKVKDLPTRLWYARMAVEHGWGRDMLSLQIQSRAHERQGKAVTNFQRTLPPLQSDLAAQLLKDPYVFDFLTLEKPFHERELETGLLQHLQNFLVELGAGFAFVGRQVHMEVGEDDFYLDLVFYHLKLRCFIVIDLKVGPFKAEYAGKMNFYLNTVDDRLRHASDQLSIGLIPAKTKTASLPNMHCAASKKRSAFLNTNSPARCRRSSRALCQASHKSRLNFPRPPPPIPQKKPGGKSAHERESQIRRPKGAKEISPGQGAWWPCANTRPGSRIPKHGEP